MLFSINQVSLSGHLRERVRFSGMPIINAQSSGFPPKRKPVIMRRKDVWFSERMLTEYPATFQTRIS